MKCFSENSCDKWLFIARFLLTLLFPVTAAETVNCHYFHTGFLDASQLFILNAFPRCFAWFCFVFFVLPRLNIVIITSYYYPMCCGMCLLNVTSLAGITRCFISWHMAHGERWARYRHSEPEVGGQRSVCKGACCSHATQYSGICLMLKKNSAVLAPYLRCCQSE